jgi:hypothetical protein
MDPSVADPITAGIVAALGAGALKSAGQVGEHVVGDAYAGLKELLKRKLGAESEVVKAVEAVEAKPESEGRTKVLAEEVAEAKLADDPEVRAAVELLRERVGALKAGERGGQIAIGDYIVQADRGSNATMNVSHRAPGESQR